MTASAEFVPMNAYHDYAGLHANWSELEGALGDLLAEPWAVNGLEARVRELQRWLQRLISQDTDAALYLMFQLASTSAVGYSASHALVCSTLCSILGRELELSEAELEILICATMTMNISMTQLQDELAQQMERPSMAQDRAIRTHPQDSALLLQSRGVKNQLWLEVVAGHHTPPPDRMELKALTPVQRLIRLLSSIDRYAAMISPRKSRPARSVGESFKAIMGQRFDPKDEVGKALARSVGLYPPGTLVKLDNRDVAVVLRRSALINHPIVISLVDANGMHYEKPVLHWTERGVPRILLSLPISSIGFELDHRKMIALGAYASQKLAKAA